MLQNLFSIHQIRVTQLSFLVHSTMGNAPYIHPGHDSILELWRTFLNDVFICKKASVNAHADISRGGGGGVEV